jgi:hypothetical protein
MYFSDSIRSALTRLVRTDGAHSPLSWGDSRYVPDASRRLVDRANPETAWSCFSMEPSRAAYIAQMVEHVTHRGLSSTFRDPKDLPAGVSGAVRAGDERAQEW